MDNWIVGEMLLLTVIFYGCWIGFLIATLGWWSIPAGWGLYIVSKRIETILAKLEKEGIV